MAKIVVYYFGILNGMVIFVILKRRDMTFKKNNIMTYRFVFTGDYGHELSNSDINNINSLESIEDKARYCDKILDRENGHIKIVTRWGVDVLQFCSENCFLMFSVYCTND